MTTTNPTHPFPEKAVFHYSMIRYMEPPDINRLSLVCKGYDAAVNDPQLWKHLFTRNGIPRVEEVDGQQRNYRRDFCILYPRTISSSIIGQFLGKVIGDVPPIKAELFNRLQSAPLEPSQSLISWMISGIFGKVLITQSPLKSKKSLKKKCVFVVMPSLIQRTIGKNDRMALDKSGDLIDLDRLKNAPDDLVVQPLVEGQQVEVRFTLKNMRVLCAYPLKGAENGPVFHPKSLNEVFDQCGNICPDKVQVYFMMERVANLSRNLPFLDQTHFVEKQGLQVMPLRERALYDAICILKSGTCPDNRDPWTYARTSDIFHIFGSARQSAIGGFVPRAGVRVSSYSCDDHPLVGVVPGCPAEVLRSLALEPLGLGEGY
jgi:hypothetical protein